MTRAEERLLAELAESPLPGARYAHDVVTRRLPAIEAEAVAARNAEIAAVVRGLDGPWPDNKAQWARDLIYRAAVLAIVEKGLDTTA